jgi:Uma2 family endonuclease
MLRGDIRQYATRHPAPEDVLLVVEVSDATLGFDRSRKARIYAESGIPEYWILNLIDRYLEVHREPQNGAYQSITVFPEAGTVSPLAAPAAAVAVGDLLP